MDESSSAFVQRSLVARLSAAQASVAEAARDLVMLTAVGEAGLGLASASQLRSADEGLQRLLAVVDPAMEAVRVDWDTFMRRLGQGDPAESTAAGPAQGAGNEVTMRERICAVLEASGEKYFTPNTVFAVLRKSPSIGFDDPKRLRKAVQNSVASMARSGVITRCGRGIYIAPGRENDPDPEEGFPGVGDDGEGKQASDTFAGAGTTWLAEGGPLDTSKEAQLGQSANSTYSARSAA